MTRVLWPWPPPAICSASAGWHMRKWHCWRRLEVQHSFWHLAHISLPNTDRISGVLLLGHVMVKTNSGYLHFLVLSWCISDVETEAGIMHLLGEKVHDTKATSESAHLHCPVPTTQGHCSLPPSEHKRHVVSAALICYVPLPEDTGHSRCFQVPKHVGLRSNKLNPKRKNIVHSAMHFYMSL